MCACQHRARFDTLTTWWIELLRETSPCGRLRVPELAGLLDPAANFPTTPWTGPALAQLAPLGLRTTVTTDTLLQAARHVEELTSADEPMAWARCPCCRAPTAPLALSVRQHTQSIWHVVALTALAQGAVLLGCLCNGPSAVAGDTPCLPTWTWRPGASCGQS